MNSKALNAQRGENRWQQRRFTCCHLSGIVNSRVAKVQPNYGRRKIHVQLSMQWRVDRPTDRAIRF